jgi:hypothetical protein
MISDKHNDELAVDRFALAMKVKLALSRTKGRGGWDDPEKCSMQELAAMLICSVFKGDPVDVANFAMMLYQRGDIGRELEQASSKYATDIARNGLKWKPISTAPKNGVELLLTVKSRAGIPRGILVGHYMAGGHCVEDHPPIAEGWYFWNGCMFDKAAEPVAWMPVPDAYKDSY